VKVYHSSDSEAENKSPAKVKKTLISSIFATKNKKAIDLSDSGSEKEETCRGAKVKKKKREKEKKRKREKEKPKRAKRRHESDSSEEEESSYRKQSPPASVDSSPASKLTPSHKSSSQRSTPLTNSNPFDKLQPSCPKPRFPSLPSPKAPEYSSESSSSRSPVYYPEVKAQPGVAPLAPLSPLSPGEDLKQDVESKNGIANGMEQEEEEDGEVHEEEEEVREPYCQPHHRPFPFPPIEQLQDRKYWAKLQKINAAINNPQTGQDQLNQIVDLILETGNFSTSAESFNFDICNLEKSVVQQIGEVLGV